jgi:hypothetical protein
VNINEAESAIADILRQLETDTDCVIDTVSLVDVEVTKLNDDRRQFLRRVLIETHRLPGSLWGQTSAPWGETKEKGQP